MEGSDCLGPFIFSLFQNVVVHMQNPLANQKVNLEKRRRVISICFCFVLFYVSILVGVWPIST